MEGRKWQMVVCGCGWLLRLDCAAARPDHTTNSATATANPPQNHTHRPLTRPPRPIEFNFSRRCGPGSGCAAVDGRPATIPRGPRAAPGGPAGDHEHHKPGWHLKA